MDPADQRELRLNVLLLGGPQAGKSSTGNTLLGSREFQSGLSPGAVSQHCRLCRRTFPAFMRRRGEETSLHLQVLDTPAYPNCLLGVERVKLDIAGTVEKVFGASLHVVVLVVRADVPLGQDGRQVVQLAEDLLGPTWRSHTVLVFSHADRVGEAGVSVEEFLRLAPSALLELLGSVEHRHHFVDNTTWLQTEGRPLLERLVALSRQNKYRGIQLRISEDKEEAWMQGQLFFPPPPHFTH